MCPRYVYLCKGSNIIRNYLSATAHHILQNMRLIPMGDMQIREQVYFVKKMVFRKSSILGILSYNETGRISTAFSLL